MNDVDFLCWIHERLINVHGEDPLFDYMHRLRDIIANTPQEQRSVGKVASNNLQELREYTRKATPAISLVSVDIVRDSRRYAVLRDVCKTKEGRLKVQAIFWNMSSRKDIDIAVDKLIGEIK